MKHIPTPQQLLNEVCEVIGVTIELINSRTRKREVVLARQYFSYFGLRHYKFTSIAIGRTLGQDHSTIFNGKNQIEDLLKSGFEKVVNDVNILIEYFGINDNETLESKYDNVLKEMIEWKRKAKKLELENKCYENQLRNIKKQLQQAQSSINKC
jgi:hypothetical protein